MMMHSREGQSTARHIAERHGTNLAKLLKDRLEVLLFQIPGNLPHKQLDGVGLLHQDRVERRTGYSRGEGANRSGAGTLERSNRCWILEARLCFYKPPGVPGLEVWSWRSNRRVTRRATACEPFVPDACALPCARPPIVLAASSGLGAETMPLDVQPKRAAAADEHAVTTTTAVHARARHLAHTHTEHNV
ncbi:hypothetical protein EYF80_008630 [Liparis tanakae]|uniref:Uncharacterized protein n=1 Tax=Liparis tanakae TaxID=230148 RepID=A0A4Z2ITW6_9TELE|nr:hypothetical protein EYF80_008630 [Liparis tanakae]